MSTTPQDTELDIHAQLERRREAVAEAWSDQDAVALVGAGSYFFRPGRDDTTYPFETHSEYFYLTDRSRPEGVLAFTPDEGWVDFVSPVTVAERLWSGASDADVHEGPSTDDLPAWLDRRRGRRLTWLGTPAPGAEVNPELTQELRFGLSAVRRRKDAVEIARMRAAQQATRAAFAAARAAIEPGAPERAVQIELEAEAFRHGAESMAYDTIVGGGPNSAVLHVAPSHRQLEQGELVLIDAGAQYQGYASDITRTYPVGAELSAEQQELHTIVHRAQLTSIALCRAGVEWREVHLAASISIAAGLGSFGLLHGEPESLVESGAVALLFPHGIGHLVGLGVRDAGGTPLAERRNDPPPFPNLRMNLPLEPGMVVTVEPGLYFVPAILQDAANRSRHRDTVNWDRVDQLIGFGGIRLEENVLITDGDGDVITADVPII
jgi:Xaa-Pro aminopeptidase